MSVMTDEVIRKLDADYIASLVADNERQRTEMESLHNKIGGLECKLEDREKQISLLTLRIERLKNHNGTP